MNQQQCLYLIPSTLGDSSIDQVIPNRNIEILKTLDYFFVEEIRSARRFLVRCGYGKPIDGVHFYELNEHTDRTDIPGVLASLGNNNMGMISEAGLPAVADPGANLVEEAYARNIRVIPLTGPSSIFLALMASGLNGQNFAFNGYLPVKENERIARIKMLEKRSEAEKQSQIFIETPYRNNHLIQSLLQSCKPGTRLCIAANISLSDEWIRTRSVGEWRKTNPPDLKRQPAVYIIQA